LNGKRIEFYQFGSPIDVLKINEQTIVAPKGNEVLVRMIARPINPSDLIPIRGTYAHRISLPAIPGYEGVGVVVDTGSFVSKKLIGKRVLPLRGEGTWQEYVKTSANYIVPIPDSIDDFTASQMYINPITAWVTCTEILKFSPNDIVLVNACGSSIGHLFAQLSKILGFRLIAVTRSNKEMNDLLMLGASHVIDTSVAPLNETVMELTNGVGADHAIDSVGGVSGNELAFSVHPNGNFLSIGLLSGKQVNWADIVKKAKVNANLFHLRNWNKNVSLDKWHQAFQHLTTLIKEKQISLMKVHSHYDLVDFQSAITVVESSYKTKGKVFLTSK